VKTPSFGHILLATDGSPEAEAAVNMTIVFAKAAPASVDVVHVWSLEVHHRHGVWDVETRSEAESLLNDTVMRIRAAGIPTDGEIMRADTTHVASAIAQTARQSHADLVVVGSRGLSDWQSIIHHSVSHELLCALDCPLLIVQAKPVNAGNGFPRVLVAIAGGDDVLPAVRAAMAGASEPGAEVLVVHVTQAIVSSQGFAYVEPEEEIHATIEQATNLLNEAGIACQAIVAHAGPVAQVVAQIAAEWRADVIVIGSSRIGDLGSMLFGSVTHGLLRATERPLLVAERTRG
jgi:nucleotide-binding universal stress UspA family protein